MPIAGPQAVSLAGGPGVSLDAAPPLPPEATRRPTLRQLSGGQPGGLGAMAGNPGVMALEGLQMMERGAQLLSQGIPGLTPQLADLIAGLRQAVPQQLAGSVPGGGGGGGAPVGTMPPAGVM